MFIACNETNISCLLIVHVVVRLVCRLPVSQSDFGEVVVVVCGVTLKQLLASANLDLFI